LQNLLSDGKQRCSGFYGITLFFYQDLKKCSRLTPKNMRYEGLNTKSAVDSGGVKNI
jgi:hypothetical protein